MSPPTGRVLALLELLQTMPGATATELAGRLCVDERTVRRDAAHLCGLGIPVRARRGRYGGFQLAPQQRGHRLSPLMLTEPEATSIVFGLAFAASAGLTTGEKADAANGSALAKIRRILPDVLMSGVEQMLAALGIERCDHSGAPSRMLIHLMLVNAVHQRRTVTLAGVQCRDGSTVVDPYEMGVTSGRGTLTGYDHGTGSVRAFDLDLIDEVRPEPETFTPPDAWEPEIFTPQGDRSQA